MVMLLLCCCCCWRSVGAADGAQGAGVSNNDLPDLPPALGHLPRPSRIALDGNSIRVIRRALLAGPCSGRRP